MRKRIIAGNWKMYKTMDEAKNFVIGSKGQFAGSQHKSDAVICPPSLYLSELVELSGRHSIENRSPNDARRR